MSRWTEVRKYSCALYELLQEGIITEEKVVDMCLSFMSEDDVREMVEQNQLADLCEEYIG